MGSYREQKREKVQINMTDSEIEAVFMQTLEGSGLPVEWVWPNVAGDKELPFVEVSFSRATPETLTLGGISRRSGICLCNLVTRSGDGALKPTEIAENLASLFSFGARFGSARITTRPKVSGGYKDGDLWRTPVTINYSIME